MFTFTISALGFGRPKGNFFKKHRKRSRTAKLFQMYDCRFNNTFLKYRRKIQGFYCKDKKITCFPPNEWDKESLRCLNKTGKCDKNEKFNEGEGRCLCLKNYKRDSKSNLCIEKLIYKKESELDRKEKSQDIDFNFDS